MILLDKVSQKWQGLLTSNFHSIFGMVWHAASNRKTVIAQPWRHLSAILWFHVIIHIFISIHHTFTKLSTHKLQVMGQHTDTSISARASKFKIVQNHFLNNIEDEPDHFKYFKNFRACALTQRAEGRNAVFCCCMDLISDTFLSRFTSFQSIPA